MSGAVPPRVTTVWQGDTNDCHVCVHCITSLSVPLAMQAAELTPFRRLFPHMCDRPIDRQTHIAFTRTSANLYPQSFILQGPLTSPQPLPKPFLHPVRSNASSFNFQYPPASLKWTSSCLRLLPRLPVTCILPSIFPSITCFRRQFLRKLWPIQTALFLFTVCMMLLSPWPSVTLLHFSHHRSSWSSPSSSSSTFQNFHRISLKLFSPFFP